MNCWRVSLPSIDTKLYKLSNWVKSLLRIFLMMELFIFWVNVHKKHVQIIFAKHVKEFLDFESVRSIGIEFHENADYLTVWVQCISFCILACKDNLVRLSLDIVPTIYLHLRCGNKCVWQGFWNGLFCWLWRIPGFLMSLPLNLERIFAFRDWTFKYICERSREKAFLSRVELIILC